MARQKKIQIVAVRVMGDDGVLRNSDCTEGSRCAAFALAEDGDTYVVFKRPGWRARRQMRHLVGKGEGLGRLPAGLVPPELITGEKV